MISVNDSYGNTKMVPDRSYMSFILSGPALDPVHWTNYFGVKPDFHALNGGDYHDRNGRKITSNSPRGLWIVRTEARCRSLALDDHFRDLKSLLKLPRFDLVGLLKARGEECLFSCFVANYNGTNSPRVNAASKEIAASCRAEIDIDIYPQVHKMQSADGKLFDVEV